MVDSLRPPVPIVPSSIRPPHPALLSVARGGLVIACLATLVSALAPPTAGDALCYHLELPKTFLAQHGLVYVPFSDNSTFPMLAEIWFLWGLALDGPVAAQLMHWLLGVLFILSTVVLATPLIGRPWAWLAAAVVAAVPAATNQMTAPLNDVALAAMVTLAVAGWWKAEVEDAGSHWYVVAGLLLGAALGIKYNALLLLPALAAGTLWRIARQRGFSRRQLSGGLTLLTVAVSTAGCWYLRSAWHTGNPMYPYFGELLGTGGPPVLRDSKTPLAFGPLDVLTAPWQITMRPQLFGGRGNELGAIFLAGLGGLLIARRLRGLGTICSLVLAYSVGWFALRQNVRFLLPIVPLLAILAAWVWAETGRLRVLERRLAQASLLGLLLISLAIPIVRCRQELTVALALESRENYLLRSEPTYATVMAARAMLPPDARILSQEHRAFYFPQEVVRESIYRRETGYDRELPSADELSESLLAAGFTHLLLAENLAPQGIRYDPTLTDLVAEHRRAGRRLACLSDTTFVDADGARRRYRLLELPTPWTGATADRRSKSERPTPIASTTASE